MSIQAQKPNTPDSGGLRGAEYDVKRLNNFSSPVTRTIFSAPINAYIRGFVGFLFFSAKRVWSLFGLYFEVRDKSQALSCHFLLCSA